MAEETIQLQAQQIFVNTGAETIIPPIGGVKDNPKVYTSTSIMELAELPKHLVIVGGGYIGLEFASMYASFGSQVTVLESYSELIAREDRDIAASVQEVLEKKGITFCLNARVQSVEAYGGCLSGCRDRQDSAIGRGCYSFFWLPDVVPILRD